jgi:endonuclease YncB( thermonuclease family)
MADRHGVAKEPTTLPVWSRTWLGAATILLLSAPAGTATQASATVSGTADIIDGDTLDVGTARVRLFGIDAPETAQECADGRDAKWACGRSAKRAAEKLTAGQVITCKGQNTDAYGRLLAVCTRPTER